MNCLTEHLGTLKTEMFVAAIIRENFDYTKWQRDYFDAMTPDEIKKDVSEFLNNNPYNGNAVRLSQRLYPESPDPVSDKF